jgi:hypothetical protein
VLRSSLIGRDGMERFVTGAAVRALISASILWAGATVAGAQSAAALAARDAFSASLAAALPPLSLADGREISVRYGATKYYSAEPLRQSVGLSAVVPIVNDGAAGLTIAYSSPTCFGCARWFLMGVDVGGRIWKLPRLQATTSLATGFQSRARSASSLGITVPVQKTWSNLILSAQGGVTAAGVTQVEARARAVRPTVAASIGWRTATTSFDFGVQAILLTALPPVVGVRFGWRPSN